MADLFTRGQVPIPLVIVNARVIICSSGLFIGNPSDILR